MNGLEPKAFCDSISDTFKRLFDSCDISFTHFIRTTDESHVNAVKTFWNTLYERGYIYKTEFKGWYCVADETFVPEMNVIVNESGDKVSSESGNAVEWSVEENYIFKLSLFEKQISDWVNSGYAVIPDFYANQTRHDLQRGLRDISISRPKTRLQWGIEVPNDNSQTVS